jgi:hypothetical protein
VIVRVSENTGSVFSIISLLIRNGYWFGRELSLWLPFGICINECSSTCNFHIDGALFDGVLANGYVFLALNYTEACLTASSFVILGSMLNCKKYVVYTDRDLLASERMIWGDVRTSPSSRPTSPRT